MLVFQCNVEYTNRFADLEKEDVPVPVENVSKPPLVILEGVQNIVHLITQLDIEVKDDYQIKKSWGKNRYPLAH